MPPITIRTSSLRSVVIFALLGGLWSAFFLASGLVHDAGTFWLLEAALWSVLTLLLGATYRAAIVVASDRLIFRGVVGRHEVRFGDVVELRLQEIPGPRRAHTVLNITSRGQSQPTAVRLNRLREEEVGRVIRAISEAAPQVRLDAACRRFRASAPA